MNTLEKTAAGAGWFQGFSLPGVQFRGGLGRPGAQGQSHLLALTGFDRHDNVGQKMPMPGVTMKLLP
jgi:hypothetical protein